MKNKNVSLQSIFSNIGSTFSFKRIQGLVENLIDREYQSGIYEESPQIIVDLSFSMRNGMLSCDIWDSESKKIKSVAVNNTADYIRKLNKARGLYRCAVLMAHDSPYGRLASSGLAIVPDVEGLSKQEEDKRLSQIFSRQLNINAESNDTEVSYYFFDKVDNYKRYMVTAIPGENKRKLLSDESVFGGVMDGKIIATRVVDRVLPLSDYIIKRYAEEGVGMYLCIEQRGQDLLIWNLYQVSEGKYVPVVVEKKKVPQVETYDQLVSYINLIEHELVRNKNYIPPERVIILTNGEKMIDMDLFRPADLRRVCLEVLGEDNSSTSVSIYEVDNAAIDGVLDIEKEIYDKREEIFENAVRREK